MNHSTHFYSFTQGSTSLIELGLKSGFHQPESSLASHSIKTFQKRTKLLRKTYFWGYILSQEELQHTFRQAYRKKTLQMIF